MSTAEPDPRPDEALVRIAQDDPAGPPGRAAVTELFRRHQDRVYHWCYRLVQDHDRAMDLAQDALYNAYRALGVFDGRVPFAAWLYVITRNRCFSAMRPGSLLRDEDAEPDSLPDAQRGPDAALESREAEEEVLQLMREHLDPVEQDALWLRCFERVPVEEITRMLGVRSASGARGVLQRARRKLRRALERRRAAEENPK